MNFRNTSGIVALSFLAIGSIFYFNDDRADRSALSASDRTPQPVATAAQRETVPLPASDRIPQTVTAPPQRQQLARRSIPKGAIVSYQPTSADVLNPERGFVNDVNLMSDGSFSYARSQGHAISRAYVRLDAYRNTRLPADFLTQLDRQFQLVRAAGIKVIPRFSYNFPKNGDKPQDSSLELTLAHIQQLKPILTKNADVIATLQGGFIGAWGEWHTSSNKLDRPAPKAKVLSALLGALPPSRMVQLRYANDIRANSQPLTLTTAFRGTRHARIAFHNDCFLSNQSDSGTYEADIPALKGYARQLAPFVAVGGETCDVTPAQHRTDCPTAESELAKFHWSYLTADFYAPTIERWKQEGCHGRIAQKLGYRLQLVRSEFPTQFDRARQLQGRFVIKNIGYASPFNPRGLELILRHQQTGKLVRLPLLKPLSKTHDPRFWLPTAGEISVDVRGTIPPTASLGGYDLLLNLPDPMPKLKDRSEYSIRLANEGTWDAKTGFNSLKRSIKLSR
jgi:Domain of unknown function (DUF4832)/Domain of unknown function (DUF4874)